MHNLLPSGADRGHSVHEWQPQFGNPVFPKRTTKILHFTWNFLATVVWHCMHPRGSLQREFQYHVSTIFPNECTCSCFKLLKQDVTVRQSNLYSMITLANFKYILIIFQILLCKNLTNNCHSAYVSPAFHSFICRWLDWAEWWRLGWWTSGWRRRCTVWRSVGGNRNKSQVERRTLDRSPWTTFRYHQTNTAPPAALSSPWLLI